MAAPPRYTIVVPMARFDRDEPALVSLRTLAAPAEGMEVIVAVGAQPARQRNIAVARARGEIVLFLDDDCSLGEDFWRELEQVFARTEVEIVGGPARLRPDAGGWEQIFHALLTHPLIVGSVSSRYGPRGTFRPAMQTDLILCNLAARRTAFARIGPFSSELYPNEENEWLDRAHAAGVGAFYDPALQVFRPQRGSPREMFRTLFRYGIGRTRQFRVSGWKFTFHQFLPLLVLAALGAVIGLHLQVTFVLLWLLASAIVAATCGGELRGGRRIMAGLVAPAIPLTYALGQIAGWFLLNRPEPAAPAKIVLLNEQGEEFV